MKYPEAKQVIVVRKDLGMSRGKMAAQVAHASLGAMLRHAWGNSEGQIGFNIGNEETPIALWLKGKFTKIVLSVENEEELIQICKLAEAKGLEHALITDAGLTEFNGVPTNTCVGIGPYFQNSFKGVTDQLKTFR